MVATVAGMAVDAAIAAMVRPAVPTARRIAVPLRAGALPSVGRQPVGLRVGSDTGIYNGTFFDLGPEGKVEIGDYCTLVGAILATNRTIVIESYTFIAHEVVLADRFASVPWEELELAPLAGSADSAGEVGIRVGENSWIGARAVLLAGANIGKGAIVGAAAVVDFAVPPEAIVAGNPARIVGWARPQKA